MQVLPACVAMIAVANCCNLPLGKVRAAAFLGGYYGNTEGFFRLLAARLATVLYEELKDRPDFRRRCKPRGMQRV